MSLSNLISFCRDNAAQGAAMYAFNLAKPVTLPAEAAFTLCLGKGLDAASRPGQILARLLAEGSGPWAVISVGARADASARSAAGRSAAARLFGAANVVGVPLEAICLVNKNGRIELIGGGL